MAKKRPKYYEFGTCLFCSKVFNLKKSLLSHMQMHIQEKHCFCFHCGYEATHISAMKYHLKTRHPSESNVVSKDYKCPLCPKRFPLPSRVQIHMVVHTRETPFECSICGTRFNCKSNWSRHMKIHQSTNKVKPKYECTLCGKHLHSQDYLTDHILITHGGVKNHECEICGKRFGRIEGLKNHLFQHTGERSFKCNQCVKTFSSLGAQKRHEKQHFQEFHKCNICGKDGIKHIRMHVLQVHRLKKHHSCVFCGKEYKNRNSLEYHILEHIKEKPAECKLCGIQFKAIGNLQKHHQHVHSNKDEDHAQ